LSAGIIIIIISIIIITAIISMLKFTSLVCNRCRCVRAEKLKLFC
jgi:hypothetical protein